MTSVILHTEVITLPKLFWVNDDDETDQYWLVDEDGNDCIYDFDEYDIMRDRIGVVQFRFLPPNKEDVHVLINYVRNPCVSQGDVDRLVEAIQAEIRGIDYDDEVCVSESDNDYEDTEFLESDYGNDNDDQIEDDGEELESDDDCDDDDDMS